MKLLCRVGVPTLVAAFACASPHALPAHLHGPEATRKACRHLTGGHCPEVLIGEELRVELLVQHHLRLRVLHQRGRLFDVLCCTLHVRLVCFDRSSSRVCFCLRLMDWLPHQGGGHPRVLAAHTQGCQAGLRLLLLLLVGIVELCLLLAVAPLLLRIALLLIPPLLLLIGSLLLLVVVALLVAVAVTSALLLHGAGLVGGRSGCPER
mmetsp:Transcript_81918/g.198507  ORF Transcript_81918/g.198507 Transcript_81918/m.198507 type:complete len:207 (+) Transcript_81918:591-1211(+)